MDNSKIALSGSAGTGKSTLVETVGRELGIPVIPEFAREIAEEMSQPNIQSMPLGVFYTFQVKILEAKLAEEAKHDQFIADRCTADNLAYLLRRCGEHLDVSDYMHKCIEHLKSYDLIIFVPWDSIPIENDGFRDINPYSRYTIHCLILGILHDNNIPYIVMKVRDMESRKMFVKNFC